MREDDPARSDIISTIILISGVVTLLQSTLGTRLPIIQGGSFAFIVPSLTILALPQWTCPPQAEIDAMTDSEQTELWQLRIRELQGAIIIASLVEVFLGFFGTLKQINHEATTFRYYLYRIVYRIYFT